MYQSIPSLTIPPGDPRGFARSPCPGVGCSPNLLCPGGRGFELEKFFHSLERKMQELLDLFQRNWRQFEKQVFFCCFILIFAKTVDVYCIFNNLDHFPSNVNNKNEFTCSITVIKFNKY